MGVSKECGKKGSRKYYGCKRVINNINIEEKVELLDVKNRITRAFERAADIDAKKIKVEIKGHTVKITGTVHSMAEKEDARRAASHAPGVTEVKNALLVQPL